MERELEPVGSASPVEREEYLTPMVEDLGQIHEVTRHHGKISSHGDSPQGKEHTGGDSGPLG
jgi:hypothetical protein